MSQLSGLAYGGINLTNGGAQGAFFRMEQAHKRRQAAITAALDKLGTLDYGDLGSRGYQELRSAIQFQHLTLDNWDEFLATWRLLTPERVKHGGDLYDLREMLLLGRASPHEVRELIGATDVTLPWYAR